MVRLFVRHSVINFTLWKQAYDAFDGERRRMGVLGHAAYQAPNDPNDVTVWHDFNDLGAAQAFADSARLKEAMKGAGIVGEPEMWFGLSV